MTRADALKAAEELVGRLSPTTNGRGYADGAPALLGERVENILRVADWLAPEVDTMTIRSFDSAEAIRQIELAKADVRADASW